MSTLPRLKEIETLDLSYCWFLGWVVWDLIYTRQANFIFLGGIFTLCSLRGCSPITPASIIRHLGYFHAAETESKTPLFFGSCGPF